jgi:hypothetical protein
MTTASVQRALDARLAGEQAEPSLAPSAPDVVTLAGYGLGLWWCLGGPTWAGIASIACDEVDGRLARLTGKSSPRGSALDWGADVALTPLALLRLGRAAWPGEEERGKTVALLLAPAVLYGQASLRGSDWRPPVGSARAAIMVGAMIAEARL